LSKLLFTGIVLWDPELRITATADNRHGNVDYTPYEGMTFHGGPASVYVRGNLVYRDGEVGGEGAPAASSSGASERRTWR
jgi:dihydropyrimidinase